MWRLQQYYSNEASGLQNKLRGSDSVQTLSQCQA